MRVLIVCEGASAGFGGEAALPLHYFRVLRRLGVAVWLVTHSRTRDELAALFPGADTIRYVEDNAFHRWMWTLGRRVPPRLSSVTFGFASRLATQLAARRIARDLVRREGIDVVHQPMPVSPKEPSCLTAMGAPVVIGPMNGGMAFPPAFRRAQGRVERLVLQAGRASSALLNRLMSGKRDAAILLVANERTRAALPRGLDRPVVTCVENGVDLALWNPPTGAPNGAASGPARFVFLGRLVDWKGVDFLLAAFEAASRDVSMTLEIVGDGDERPVLEKRAASMPSVRFTGWLPQAECAARLRSADCLVLPSLYECGGAVVLEAMALGKPVIATDWGGPADYLDPSCGILVPPTTPAGFVDGLREALVRIAGSRELRERLGGNGLAKVREHFDWDLKVQAMLDVYRRAMERPST